MRCTKVLYISSVRGSMAARSVDTVCRAMTRWMWGFWWTRSSRCFSMTSPCSARNWLWISVTFSKIGSERYESRSSPAYLGREGFSEYPRSLCHIIAQTRLRHWPFQALCTVRCPDELIATTAVQSLLDLSATSSLTSCFTCFRNIFLYRLSSRTASLRVSAVR